MLPFQNILVTIDTRAEGSLALEQAAEVAAACNASLKVIDIVREFGWLLRVTGHARREQMVERMMADKARRLEAVVQPLRGEGLRVETKVLHGSSSTAIIREVLRCQHDLVLKEAKGDVGGRGYFGRTGMQLLRKCPCPVWMVKPIRHAAHRRVLAAVDASCPDDTHAELNSRIMELARAYADWQKQPLEVVHAWELFGESLLKEHMSAEEMDELIVNSEGDVQLRFDAFLEPYKLDHRSPRVHLLRGEAGFVIPRFVEENEIDLIVMGTVARGGLAGVLMGNTAEMILRSVRCSVLAIKPADFVSPVQ